MQSQHGVLSWVTNQSTESTGEAIVSEQHRQYTYICKYAILFIADDQLKDKYSGRRFSVHKIFLGFDLVS